MKRLGFALTDEDMAILRDLQQQLQVKLGMGKISQITAIRWALRQAVSKQVRDALSD